MNKYPHLFSPCRIRSYVFKNRILSAPIGAWVFSPDNYIFDYAIGMFEAKAIGGASAVTVGHTEVNYGDEDTDGFGLYFDFRDAKGTAAMAEFADAIQRHGCHASVELNYGGVFTPIHKGVCYGPTAFTAENGKQVFEITPEKMEEIIANYVASAVKMKTVGFHMVTIHGAHGWLPAQFLSVASNRRSDEYGGSLENRMRFPLRLVNAVRDAVGPDMVIEYRISGCDPKTEPVEFEEMIAFLNAMESVIDLVHISSGVGHTEGGADGSGMLHTFPTYLDAEGSNVHLAAPVKERIGTPVAVVGAIAEPGMAEQILAEGKADFVAMGRALIADPDLPNKARRGEDKDVCPCIGCYSCLETMHDTHFLACNVNPRSGREHSVPPISPALASRRVVVVGGGPSGLQASITAAKRGHEVILLEKTDQLGGLLKITDRNKVKSRLNRYKNYLMHQVASHDIDVKLGFEANKRSVSELEPEVVLVASGSDPVVPGIPGIDSGKVFDCVEVHAQDAELGDRIVIVGGNMTGCETALYMAELGKTDITVIDMAEHLHADANGILSMSLEYHMKKAGIKTLAGAICTAVMPDGVRIRREDGAEQFLAADSVVFATGMRSRYDVFMELQEAAPFVTPIGDCISPSNVRQASWSAYFAALDI